MLFNTIPFWATFIVFLAIYAIIRQRSRLGMTLWVTACSLAFYYLASGWLMLLLPLCASTTWLLTEDMRRRQGRTRLVELWAAILLCLLPLAFFKYANFGSELLHQLLSENFPIMKIALPTGLSFFTFQAISYAVDVYRGRFRMEVDFLQFLFYLSFFPLLLAGPITRAQTFFPQVSRPKPVSSRLIYGGLWLIIIGLLKKSLIADYIAQYNNWIFDDPLMYSGFENLMAIIGYHVQIYCDFSGYSDMSIGIAALMGIRLRDNFAQPYNSQSVGEFWRRWHISLSTWFRDYLYIPLGGNRRGKAITYVNNFLTMLVAGIWHGSTAMYLIWGALHGVGLVINKACAPLTRRLPDTWPVRLACWALTMAFLLLTWVYFRSPSLTVAHQILSQIFCHMDLAYLPYFLGARPLWTAFVLIALVLHHWSTHRRFIRLQARFVYSPWVVKLLLFMLAVQLVIQFHTSSVQPFIYAQY